MTSSKNNSLEILSKEWTIQKQPTECHYIPHHAVLKDSTTTPLRVVSDCSFKQGEEPSLNDCLQPGPPLLNDLTGILLRFRLHQYAITADIEKAFLHVNLDQADRDATRFYWLSNTDDPESEFIVYRFKSVMFGATSSPFILNATLNKHLTQSTDQVSMDMLRNLYVDDLASGTNDDSAVNYYQNARRCHRWASISGHGVQTVLVFNILQPKIKSSTPAQLKRYLAWYGT